MIRLGSVVDAGSGLGPSARLGWLCGLSILDVYMVARIVVSVLAARNSKESMIRLATARNDINVENMLKRTIEPVGMDGRLSTRGGKG